jgi:hypothetical protein
MSCFNKENRPEIIIQTCLFIFIKLFLPTFEKVDYQADWACKENQQQP